MLTKELELPVLLPAGPDCERCTARLQTALVQVKGVARATVDSARSRVHVTYDPNVATLSRIEAEARRIGAEIDEKIDHQTVELKDLDCPDCAAGIEKAVGRMPGVMWAAANFAAGQLFVEHEAGKVRFADIRKAVEAHGVRACPLVSGGGDCDDVQTLPAWRSWLAERRKSVTTVLSAALMLAALASGYFTAGAAVIPLYAAAVLVGGWSTARSAWMSVRARAIDMNVLMTVAVIGAMAIGDWFEAATVVVLYNIGGLLQAYAMDRTRRSIRALMDLSPTVARVRREGLEPRCRWSA